MILYLIRHGEAGGGIPDASRALTEQGRLNSQWVFAEHQQAWASLDGIIHSPYLRAQQSAELLSAYSPAAPRSTATTLTPDTSVDECLQYLQAKNYDDQSKVALVGHNPLFSALLNTFLAKPNGYYHLGTSAAAALSLEVLEPGCAELIWLEAGF